MQIIAQELRGNTKMKYILTLLILFVHVLSAQESLDKIVAVVDNEMILKSELDLRVSMESSKSNLNSDDPALRKRILEMSRRAGVTLSTPLPSRHTRPTIRIRRTLLS